MVSPQRYGAERTGSCNRLHNDCIYGIPLSSLGTGAAGGWFATVYDFVSGSPGISGVPDWHTSRRGMGQPPRSYGGELFPGIKRSHLADYRPFPISVKHIIYNYDWISRSGLRNWDIRL